MSRDLVLNLIKISVLGLLAILLLVRLWQGEAVERRLLDLQGTVQERAGKLDQGVAALGERAEKVEKRELKADVEDIERDAVSAGATA